MPEIQSRSSHFREVKSALENNVNSKTTGVVTSKTHVSSAVGQRLNAEAQKASHNEIMKSLAEEIDNEAFTQSDAPVIRSADKQLTRNSQALLMMLKYQQSTAGMSEAQLNNALAAYAAQAEGRVAKAQEAANEIDEIQAEFDKTKETWLSASNELDAAKKNKDISQQEYDKAKAKLEEAEKKLAQAKPEDKQQLQEAKDLAEKAFKLADSNLNVTSQEVKSAEQKALNLKDKVQELNVKINDKTAELNKNYANVASPTSTTSIAVEKSERALATNAVMMLLIMQMLEKIDAASQDKLQSDLQINRTMSKARVEEMKRKSDEYEEQVRKAKEAEEMAGCIGKILGGLAIAFGAITTIFGGGGVALMAVGIALMAADPIVEAITGESLTGMVMNPLMEHVFMPLMDFIGDVVADIFDKTPLGLLLNAIQEMTGVQIMDTVHTVVTAVVAIAAIVAVAMVAKSAVKFMVEKMAAAMTTAIVEAIKKSIQQIISKIVPQIVKTSAKQAKTLVNEVAKQVSQQIGALTKNISSKMDKVSQQVNKSILNVLKPDDPKSLQNMGDIALNRMGQLRTGVMMSNAGTQAGFNIVTADLYADASEAMADYTLAQTDFDILQALLKSYIDSFTKTQQTNRDISLLLSDSLKKSADTGRFVLNNMKA